MGGSIQRAFKDLRDPRDPSGRRHRLPTLLTLAICGIICGAQGWTDIVEFGRAKVEWFKTFLDLPHGIPSHDTFGRVFARLKPRAFERCFNRWTKGLAQTSGGRLIAIDGKTLRRSFDAAAGKGPSSRGGSTARIGGKKAKRGQAAAECYPNRPNAASILSVWTVRIPCHASFAVAQASG